MLKIPPKEDHELRRTIKRIWNCINSVLIGLVILLAVALVGVRLIGLDLYVVLSGSMEPTYKTGSVIYVKEIDTDRLQVGDVITFHLNGDTIATHRVVDVTVENGETAFRTKGDANDVEDASAVPANQVIGTPVFTIPYLGYLATYIQSTSGRYAAIAVGAALLLMVFLPDMILGEGKEAKEKAE